MARLPSASRLERRAALLLLAALLAGCGQTPTRQATYPGKPYAGAPANRNWFALPSDDHAQEVVLYALGLLDTGYRFGGKNPEAGLDCSGMVSYIYGQAAGLRVQGSAADIARNSRTIPRDELRPGDLVFFNTLNRSFSHVGIYIGDGQFVHSSVPGSFVRVVYFVGGAFAAISSTGMVARQPDQYPSTSSPADAKATRAV